jgi:excisionase family DNA binding protein
MKLKTLIKIGRRKMKQIEVEDYPPILTATEISKILKISKPTAYTLMERPDFPLLRVGRCKRVMRDHFKSWLENNGEGYV